MLANTVLEVSNLVKSFGSLHALRGVSLSASVGDSLLILGANGSGKSTLLRIIVGLLAPDSGSIQAPSHPIGYLAHQSGLYAMLTVRENMLLYRAATGDKRSLDETLEEWSLGSIANQLAGTLSRGQLARASLARAFMGNPRLVVLDEPSANLDDKTVEQLTAKIQRQRGNTALLLATHDTTRLAHVCDRALVLQDGAVAYESQGTDRATAIDFYQSVNR